MHLARPALLPFCRPPSAKLLRVATEDDDEDLPGIERLLALTDGLMLHGALDPDGFRWPNIRAALDVLLDGISGRSVTVSPEVLT